MVLRALRRAVRELSHCVAELFACQLEDSEESCARYQSFCCRVICWFWRALRRAARELSRELSHSVAQLFATKGAQRGWPC
jgi:hypothetical protein